MIYVKLDDVEGKVVNTRAADFQTRNEIIDLHLSDLFFLMDQKARRRGCRSGTRIVEPRAVRGCAKKVWVRYTFNCVLGFHKLEQQLSACLALTLPSR